MITVIEGGCVVTPLTILRKANVVIEDERITKVFTGSVRNYKADKILSGAGCVVAPGFIDLHVHGGGGRDFLEAHVDAIGTVLATHASGGTTALLATLRTAPIEAIEEALHVLASVDSSELPGASILGVHLEGPYLNPEQIGGQDASYVRLPDVEEVCRFIKICPKIRRITVAPELPGALELGVFARRMGILCSIGHSSAIFTQVVQAYFAGYTHVTHVYSSMSTIRREKAYRFPGLLEATFAIPELTTEIIGDGHHLPPSLMRLVIGAKGADKVCAITDAMEGAGLGEDFASKIVRGRIVLDRNVPDGYEVCPYPEGYVAKLLDHSSFAGSAALMVQVLRNLVFLGVASLIDAVKMVTLTPARVLGIDVEYGSIAPGKRADLVVLDEKLAVKHVLRSGKLVYSEEERGG